MAKVSISSRTRLSETLGSTPLRPSTCFLSAKRKWNTKDGQKSRWKSFSHLYRHIHLLGCAYFHLRTLALESLVTFREKNTRNFDFKVSDKWKELSNYFWGANKWNNQSCLWIRFFTHKIEIFLLFKTECVVSTKPSFLTNGSLTVASRFNQIYRLCIISERTLENNDAYSTLKFMEREKLSLPSPSFLLLFSGFLPIITSSITPTRIFSFPSLFSLISRGLRSLVLPLPFYTLFSPLYSLEVLLFYIWNVEVSTSFTHWLFYSLSFSSPSPKQAHAHAAVWVNETLMGNRLCLFCSRSLILALQSKAHIYAHTRVNRNPPHYQNIV